MVIKYQGQHMCDLFYYQKSSENEITNSQDGHHHKSATVMGKELDKVFLLLFLFFVLLLYKGSSFSKA